MRPKNSVSKSVGVRLDNQKVGVIWFTGLSGSGKSTLANELHSRLVEQCYRSYVLDGDTMRLGLCRDLGYTKADRTENIRRVGEVGRILVDAGLIVITAFISPFNSDRILARKLFDPRQFVEVYLNTPFEVCESRDTKGLYARARRGEMANFTGLDSEYEPPEDAEIVLDTSKMPVQKCIQELIQKLTSMCFIK